MFNHFLRIWYSDNFVNHTGIISISIIAFVVHLYCFTDEGSKVYMYHLHHLTHLALAASMVTAFGLGSLSLIRVTCLQGGVQEGGP